MSNTSPENLSQDQTDFQANTSLTLASLLATIAALCVSVLAASLSSKDLKFTPFMFGIVGYVSIVTAALLVDWVLDDCFKIDTRKRWFYLNGGYLFFSLVMAAIAFTVMVTSHIAIQGENGFDGYAWFSYGAVAVSLFLKVMVRKDFNILLVVLLGVSAWAWYLISARPKSYYFGGRQPPKTLLLIVSKYFFISKDHFLLLFDNLT